MEIPFGWRSPLKDTARFPITTSEKKRPTIRNFNQIGRGTARPQACSSARNRRTSHQINDKDNGQMESKPPGPRRKTTPDAAYQTQNATNRTRAILLELGHSSSELHRAPPTEASCGSCIGFVLNIQRRENFCSAAGSEDVPFTGARLVCNLSVRQKKTTSFHLRSRTISTRTVNLIRFRSQKIRSFQPWRKP